MPHGTVQRKHPFGINFEDVWNSSPGLVIQFINLQSDYEQLCTEVAYILKKKLQERAIEISNITWRAKKLDSFINKIQRKNYSDPFSEVTDFAGVRVVCLYRDDVDKIENVIDKEFKIIETVNKYDEMETDRFGYGAIHYLVKLGRSSSGARYDDLKEMLCEIQVRTVLQDAWAIIGHHLVYKQESDVPIVLQRKLNSLSGMFETADDQFLTIRKDRINYVKEVRSNFDKPKEFLTNDINYDSFKEFLNWKFSILSSGGDHMTRMIFDDLKRLKYKSLNDLNDAVDNAASCLLNVNKKLKDENELEESYLNASAQLIISLGIYDNITLKNPHMPDEWKNAIMECKEEKD